MTRRLIMASLLIIALGHSAGALSAISYDFKSTNPGASGSPLVSDNGTPLGAATMTFSVNGNQVIVNIDNTTEIRPYENQSLLNLPGITGLGFNLTGEATLQNWSMKAFSSTGTESTIGGTSGCGSETCQWGEQPDEGGGAAPLKQFNLEYLYATQNIHGALYNPDALALNPVPAFGPNPYFTTATLTLTFNSTVESSSFAVANPWVRMMRVGADGEGSLHMPGTNGGNGGGGNGGDVPEPSSLALAALGLVGMGRSLLRRRTT